MKKIISVVGARPNFMKIAPFIKAIENYNDLHPQSIQHILVHTGQHYDIRMSEAFFSALNIPDPDINLEIGSGTHAEQVGNTMIEFEKVLRNEKPDWVVVVGDVNATLACSVTAKKEHIKCCHIEAGLRSGDLQMPEEINRLVTDRLSDLLFTPDRISGENLKREGVPGDKIRFVGNIMIDTLEANRQQAVKYSIEDITVKNLIHNSGTSQRSLPHLLRQYPFGVVTLHRPSNVDSPEILQHLVNFLTDEVCRDMVLFWPMHPRSKRNAKDFGLWDKLVATTNLYLLEPINYHEMLRLNMDARIMLTDSGGLQEECTVLGTPCLTLRWNTERPVTLREHGGASVLVGNDINLIRKEYRQTLLQERRPERPELWDGKTAGRIVLNIMQENGMGQ
jgi:UDP-N-acetylglucosamine 2-epimerase (non-hydrolysing)